MVARSGFDYPSVFFHEGLGIKTLVHGDDYVSAGPPEALEWLHKELEKEYEIKSQFLGKPDGTRKWSQEGKAFNRIIRWTPEGWELEADPRHAELVIEQFGIKGQKGVSTPGTYWKEEDLQVESEEEPCPADSRRHSI